MAFYILVSIAVVLGVWMLARSRVLRAWLRGRGSDPSASATARDNDI